MERDRFYNLFLCHKEENDGRSLHFALRCDMVNQIVAEKGRRNLDQIYDVLIIGGGGAAASAALTCRNRGKTVAVIYNKVSTSSLYKAEKITNYPGLPSMTGAEMAELFRKQMAESGAVMIEGRALNAVPMGDFFGVAVGNDYYSARTLILATGITREKLYPGESEYLGRGVSYCATCDGMLYRGKKVAIVGGGDEAKQDADFLEGIGCEVLRFPQNGKYEITGGLKADTLHFAGESYPVDGIFIIKDTVSVTRLVPGLRYENGGIVTERNMATDVPGVFAAGDCTGKPFQIAKAVGEGNIAALSACEYLEHH